MVCLKGFVYLARGKGKSWLGFTHDPGLDLTILQREGYETVVSLTPTLPIGVALYVLQELRGLSGLQKRSLFNQSLLQAERLWKKTLQTLSWGLPLVDLEDDSTGSSKTANDNNGNGKISSRRFESKNIDEELTYWSHQAAQILQSMQELPDSFRQRYALHIYGPVRSKTVESELVTGLVDLRVLAETLEGRILYMGEIEKALTERWRRERLSYPTGNLEDMMHLLALVGAVEVFPSLIMEGKDKGRCLRCGQNKQIAVSSCVRCGREKCYYCDGCLSMGESRLCRPLYALAGDEGWIEQWQEKVEPWFKSSATSSAISSATFSTTSSTTSTATSSSSASSILEGKEWHGQEFRESRKKNHRSWPLLSFPLTEAQEEASDDLLKWLDGEKNKEALVWAACGAGKTEVSFAAIAQLLEAGGRVLFAVPRRDVVLELEPRIQKAFPGVSVVTLYGSSPRKYDQAQLVIATTHQVIRFYRAFDLVVLDEVDAFPYQGSEMLYHAVMRSKKKEGSIVFMTATPDHVMKKKVKEKKLSLVTIPARHHGYPVPEPQMILEKEWRWNREQLIFPDKLLNFLHRTVEGDLSQVFIFVPSIFLAQRVGESLKEATKGPPFNDFKGSWVEYSHSRDPQREAKRQAFSQQLFPFFVTTSIMERGITVPRANVVVLFAENERIYDERTLIQMAGRAGRSTERPYGDVWFVGTRLTASMKEAERSIVWLNEEARKKGYLHGSTERIRPLA
ncbi:DEAD/DEAH box helicase [Heliorestis acidaminivorans]|uniref:DEAD/DEAH box helicase n=1 Tax=Heliorestis acidaminivorans TaxID=553427 RepID=UPI0014781239|nr:DEAD/DEAH box helicase [Heliorestis acidaminivorans]